jgi:hypothetical protein
MQRRPKLHPFQDRERSGGGLLELKCGSTGSRNSFQSHSHTNNSDRKVINSIFTKQLFPICKACNRIIFGRADIISYFCNRKTIDITEAEEAYGVTGLPSKAYSSIVNEINS